MAQDYVSAYMRDGGGVVILYNKKKNRMTIPTGKIEEGESPQEALFREMFEELGIEVKRPKMWHLTHHLSPKGNPYTGHHFVCESEGELENREPEKHILSRAFGLSTKGAWKQLADIERG